jgi:hypothetical protein
MLKVAPTGLKKKEEKEVQNYLEISLSPTNSQ